LIPRGFALWLEAMRWQRAVDATLAPLSLTHTQYLVLATASSLAKEIDDAPSQRAIAERAGLDETTMSRVVRTLTDRSLLDRGDTFEDRRAWRVRVTSSGRAVLRNATASLEMVANRFFANQTERAANSVELGRD
jgi:DNA-binding MarR family transcriptional regulator